MGDRSIILSSKSQFQKVRTLGYGAFGCVDLCKAEQKKSYAKKGEQVAIKRMKRENISDAEMAKETYPGFAHCIIDDVAEASFLMP